MNRCHLFIIFSLLFRLITVTCSRSPRIKYRVTPIKDLKIDQKRFKGKDARPISKIYLSREEKQGCILAAFDREILYDLYEMAETGDTQVIKELDLYPIEIFEQNARFAYTPAEWAIYNGQIEVLKVFIEKSLIFVYGQSIINAISTNLLALAIQKNNFEAVECIIVCTGMELRGQGFLSIAAQHHSSYRILDYLLNDCNLKKEINEPDASSYYLSPLNACVKFNNFDAAITFIKHGATLLLENAKNDSPLADIFRLHKVRMLRVLLNRFPGLGMLIDNEGDSLYHYAVIYSHHPEFIHSIRELCPDLSVNIRNESGLTPLNTSFKMLLKHEMIMALISVGADIFHFTEEQRSPLKIILENNYETFFVSILESYRGKSYLISKLVEYICDLDAWNWMDRVLEVYSDIPSSWIDFSRVTLSVLLRKNAWRTFRYFLRISRSEIPQGVLGKIVRNGSKEFLQIAVEHGADIEEISEKDKQMVQEKGDNEMLNLIEDLSIKRKFDLIRDFQFE